LTTDGAANERLGASQIVGEANSHHCDAHNIQLCVEDVLGNTSKVAACGDHRAVIRKAHDLVVLINGRKDISAAFSELTARKRLDPAFNRKFEKLVINNETRWDSELAMLERLVAFDPEISELYRRPELGIAPECILTREEFDLAFAMVQVLEPLRLFTKFVQSNSTVTLAHVPHLVNDLVSKLAPDAFTRHLVGRHESVAAKLNAFQRALVASIRERYGEMFSTPSLARVASLFLPGMRYRDFNNFPNENEEELVALAKARVAEDAAELVSPERRERTFRNATFAINDLRDDLDGLDPNLPENNPLRWIPLNCDDRVLFPVAKLYLAIPATSAQDERNFSSAGFTLSRLRTRMDIDNFRKEHRIRCFLTVGGADGSSQEGRAERTRRALLLCDSFEERFDVRAPAAGQ
jgi:hypothetical protein